MDDDSLPDKELFRPDEAANILRKSKRTVYRMIETGKLPVVESKGLMRIPREALRRAYECRTGSLAKK